MGGEIAKEGQDAREEELVGFVGLFEFVELWGCVGFSPSG